MNRSSLCQPTNLRTTEQEYRMTGNPPTRHHNAEQAPRPSHAREIAHALPPHRRAR